MRPNNSVLQNPLFSAALTLTGILLGLLLSILAAWADYEATSYGFMRRAHSQFNGLTCPAFIGKNESKTISIKVSNPTEQTIFPGVATQISASREFDSKIEHIQLEPGEQAILQRTVGPENIDLGFFIFVDVQVSAMYPLPARESTCGILVFPVSSGALILILGTALSILLMAAGTFLSSKNKRPARSINSIMFIVMGTFLAMIFSFMGWWLQTFVVIAVLLLTLLLMAGTLFQRT